MDGASLSTGEEEFRGVSVKIELVVGGNDFKAVFNDILSEYGGAGFFVSIAELAKPWVYS